MAEKLGLLAGFWLIYFLLHSLFASLWLKHRIAAAFPSAMPYYRLLFNLLAVVMLVPPLWLLLDAPGPVIWQWRGWPAWLMNGLALLAITGFLYSLRFYDSGEFLGIRQIRDAELRVEDQEHLRLSPLHRFVRHPWYFFALILLWTRDMTPEMLLTAILLSIYFVLGSRLEDRKLEVYYGAAYRKYAQQVAGVFPLPWKCLDAATAAEIEAMANTEPRN